VLLGFFFRDFSLCYLQAHRRVKAITLIDGVYFLGVALTFAGLNLLGVFDKAIIAIWVHIIFAWLSSIVALFPTLKGIKFDFHLTLKELKTISNFGRYSLSTGIGEIVYYQADLLMLGYLFEPKTVAVYNAGRLLFRFYSLLSQSLNLLLFPGTSSLYAQMRLLDIKSMFEKILAYYWTLMLILNIPLFFGANFLLEVVYSGRYPESVIIFRIFLILSFVEPLYTMSMSVLYGIGKPEKVFQPLMISVPFFIRMNSFLMPLFNGLGAALSFGIMNIFLGIFLLKSLKKEAKISLFNSFNYVKMYPHILRKSWEFLSSRI
jgi:O-antigen/teichoic acid export membrane protein